MNRALVVAIFFLLRTAAAQECGNDFDLVFVLDFSGSVKSGGWTQQLDFARDVMDKLPLSTVTLSYFNDQASLALNSERDHGVVHSTLDTLRTRSPTGGTFIGMGISTARDAVLYSDRIKVMIVSTDGNDNPASRAPNTKQMAMQAKTAGYTLIAVGVTDNVGRQTLVDIASSPSERFVHHVDDYSGLVNIIGSIIDETCVSVVKVSPSTVCLGTSPTVEVTGTGFQNGDKNEVLCRYNDDVKAGRVVGNTKIECDAPRSDDTASYVLEVSLNGKTFTRSNITIKVASCPSYGLWLFFFFVFGCFIPSICTSLFLVWFFWHYLRSWLCPTKKKTENPYAELTDVMPLPVDTGPLVAEPSASQIAGKLAPGKWAPVDTSHYVWSREGGTARPLSVGWGELGATASAPLGDRTRYRRDPLDDEVSFGIRSAFHATPGGSNTLSGSLNECCGSVVLLLWHSFYSLYKFIDSLRPHPNGPPEEDE